MDNGEWVYGYVLIDTAPCTLKAKGMCACKHDGSDAFIIAWDDEFHEYSEYQVASDTVGQYTGMTDKNEVKIFEGDIVSTPKYGVDNGKGQNYSGKDKFVVGYSDGTYTLENSWRKFCLRPDIDAVVCGNIYDSPELLEVKK